MVSGSEVYDEISGKVRQVESQHGIFSSEIYNYENQLERFTSEREECFTKLALISLWHSKHLSRETLFPTVWHFMQLSAPSKFAWLLLNSPGENWAKLLIANKLDKINVNKKLLIFISNSINLAKKKNIKSDTISSHLSSNIVLLHANVKLTM